jgi:hypothetical protein
LLSHKRNGMFLLPRLVYPKQEETQRDGGTKQEGGAKEDGRGANKIALHVTTREGAVSHEKKTLTYFFWTLLFEHTLSVESRSFEGSIHKV